MPFDVSEEQSLLSSMISDRDAQISSLMHQLHSASELLHNTQQEHQTLSSARKAQRGEHTATIQRLKEEHTAHRETLSKFEQSIQSGGGLRVHEYAALMRTANSSAVESSYVLRLQAQLCRAMHSLGVMESQLALVKDIFSGLIKFMKEDLSHMADDRTRREIELMNALAKVDDEKRVMGVEMEKKIQEKEELLEQVREEYEELGLEYDENEVKCALEVRYLLEQIEKVKDDKIRLEKELFAALLEREEQINRLKLENVSLEEKLDGLKKEDIVKGKDDDATDIEGQKLLGKEENNEDSSTIHCDIDNSVQKCVATDGINDTNERVVGDEELDKEKDVVSSINVTNQSDNPDHAMLLDEKETLPLSEEETGSIVVSQEPKTNEDDSDTGTNLTTTATDDTTMTENRSIVGDELSEDTSRQGKQ